MATVILRAQKEVGKNDSANKYDTNTMNSVN